MTLTNQTSVHEFILVGFTDLYNIQSFLFIAFFSMYVLTLLGNISIIAIIKIAPRLHTPMYFFISNLSLIDVCYSSTITPKTLLNIALETEDISLPGCVTQMYFFVALLIAECFLLAVMAYDRYVAICNPLLYLVVMNKRVCILMVTILYIISLILSAVHTSNVFSVSFCGPNKISNFYCDPSPLLKLSCSDTSFKEVVLSAICATVISISITAVFLSYIYIISTILKIRSSEGRRKAFSTCASHFITVTLYFGSLVFIHVFPNSHHSLNKNRFVGLVYTMIIPMLNPMIYSLRNNDVKQAVKKVLKIKQSS
ncbi:olfactory receptor 1038-like [Microcaecilia unicolor]|uniref:Olfactory receptor n=1 Tax=Microcaecilia unicolor TaxID=1415580 RepID=A0A6P7X7J2_9AMPH|nr:olfactory receptor 1038-like [Microcaecilia unicolor]